LTGYVAGTTCQRVVGKLPKLVGLFRETLFWIFCKESLFVQDAYTKENWLFREPANWCKPAPTNCCKPAPRNTKSVTSYQSGQSPFPVWTTTTNVRNVATDAAFVTAVTNMLPYCTSLSTLVLQHGGYCEETKDALKVAWRPRSVEGLKL